MNSRNEQSKKIIAQLKQLNVVQNLHCPRCKQPEINPDTGLLNFRGLKVMGTPMVTGGVIVSLAMSGFDMRTFKRKHRRYEYPSPPTHMRGFRKNIPFYTSHKWWKWWRSLGPEQRDQYILDNGEYQ